MILLKLEFNCQQILKIIVLSGITAFWFLHPSLVAIANTKSSIFIDANRGEIGDIYNFQLSASQHLLSSHRLLAQLMVEQCGATMEGVLGEDYVQAETANYFAFICPIPDKKSWALVTINKERDSNGMSTGGVILPLQRFQDNHFVAIDGNHHYILTPSVLTVTKNGRIIVSEKILRWWHK